jgi:hypothetical protein
VLGTVGVAAKIMIHLTELTQTILSQGLRLCAKLQQVSQFLRTSKGDTGRVMGGILVD